MSGIIVKSVIRALAIAHNTERPVDWQLRQFFKSNPGLGRRDRGLVAETLFEVLRNRRLYLHLAQGGSGPLDRRLMLLAWSWPNRVPTSNPLAQLDPNERDWLARVLAVEPSTLPPAVALSVPDWFYQRVCVGKGEQAGGEILQAMLSAAPLDLRVNTSKVKRDEALASLQAAGISASAFAAVPSAIRVEGKPALESSPAFEAGWVEVQDAGSQILTYLVNPKRGQIVVDFCAGAGGKALALAAMMKDSGQVFACDVSLSRLQKMRPRLVRAGLSNIQPFAIDDENDPKLKRLAGKADLVLVDAPCSGSGTLRRNPDLKWRWKESDLAELHEKQIRILEAAARLVKPGGALVYATCSLLDEENDAVCARFEQSHPDWQCESAPELLLQAGVDVAAGVTERVGERVGEDVGVSVGNALANDFSASKYLKLRPDLQGTDAFFAARWRRA